jgi:DHA1 family bicyclomycin/chloramphenicol resistance-like MFS transporter
MPDGAALPIEIHETPHRGIGFVEFVGLVSAMMAMNALATDIMLPGMAQIGTSLGIADANERQWIITAFLLGFGAAQILYGPISDRVGRRPLLVGGIAFYGLFNFAAALAPSFAVLLTARVLQGVAIAATRVVVVSLVRDCYGGRQMARVMSLALLVMLAVPILAPSLGQVIMLVFSWRATFMALAIFAAVVVIWILRRLPETLHPEYRREISLRSIDDGVRRTLGDRQAVGYMLAQTLLFGALLGFINSMPQIFADVFHAPALLAPVFASIGASLAVASLLNARIVVRLGMRLLSHTALIAFILVAGLHLAVAALGGETIAEFAVLQAATLFCFVLAASNFGALCMEHLGEVAGTAASVQGFVSTVFGALIGFGIGQGFDGTTVPMTGGFLGVGIATLAIVLVTERFRLFRRPPVAVAG